ncbi:hypothetical protein H6796_03225 [Candidatus Nomurabacteria bacterium]|nr:hypothetical protein [Candidatus Nomurabacteria bacterium]
MNKIKTYFYAGFGLAALAVVYSATAPQSVSAARCGGVETSIVSCPQDNSGGVETNGIWGILLIAVRIMVGAIAIVAVGGIIYGSILYTTAGDNGQQVEKAIKTILNVVVGIALFAGMWAISEWLIPGGIFK